MINYTPAFRIIIDLFAISVTIYALTQPIATRGALYQNNEETISASGEYYPNKTCVSIVANSPLLDSPLVRSECNASSTSPIQKELLGMYITFLIFSIICLIVCLFNLHKSSDVIGILHMVLSFIILGWLLANIKTVKSLPSQFFSFKLVRSNLTEFTTASILIITALSVVILKELLTNGYIRMLAKKLFT
jgi:hypothetical protein